MVPAGFLNKTATVYGETVATGAYTTVLQSNLACALRPLDVRPATSGMDRAELSALRRLVWDATYVMPETAQLLIDGLRWDVVSGTFQSPDTRTGTNVIRTCDVRRVD